jgi:hypothetical protein
VESGKDSKGQVNDIIDKPMENPVLGRLNVKHTGVQKTANWIRSRVAKSKV